MRLNDLKTYGLAAWAWASTHAVILATAGLLLASAAASFYGWRANTEHKRADRYAAAADGFRAKGDEAFAKVAKLEKREADLDKEVARLREAQTARRRELPPIPARAVQPPADLGELRTALVTAGLHEKLLLEPEAPSSRVSVGDAKLMFSWKASADRVPGLEARLEADARLQQASDALVAGLTADLSATRETSAQKSVVIDMRTSESAERLKESSALRTENVMLRKGAKWKVGVSFTLGTAAGYGLGKLFKLF